MILPISNAGYAMLYINTGYTGLTHDNAFEIIFIVNQYAAISAIISVIVDLQRQ